MQRIVNPKQTRLFDPFDNVLTGKTRKRLLDGWAGVFRHIILEPVTHDLSMRTLERYMDLFEKDALARTIMREVTVQLVALLEINIDKQRLDSTHIFSDMASFGRTRLMGVAIKRFLTQLKRHARKAYELLDEQCEVHEEKVCVKKKTGGNVMQNPSDPGATYDGHKGPGYQVQLSETCHPDNEVQLITCALPQTAVEPDSTATSEVLDNLEESELLPQEMFVDTHYCSDENVQNAAQRGVELVGPTPPGSGRPQDPDQLNIDDFDIGEKTEEVICCPAGYQPESSVHDKFS